jgi:hypothetical protein
VAWRLAALPRTQAAFPDGCGMRCPVAAVTFCSGYPAVAVQGVDRFVDRDTCANGAISAGRNRGNPNLQLGVPGLLHVRIGLSLVAEYVDQHQINHMDENLPH